MKTSLSRVARVSRVRESGWPNNPANLAVGDLPTKSKPHDDPVRDALKVADEAFLSWRITLAIDAAIEESSIEFTPYMRAIAIITATAEIHGREGIGA